ncbi:MAG: TPM domain-containing protein [Muribaculaceae bacterium]|nr:TPM domain-containing protein [Muribaculaceae bacterium]
MSRNTIYSTLLMLLMTLSMSAAVPEKPTQKLLVWDYAGIMDPAQVQLLEDSLEYFSRTTSNQIVVMTVTNDILDGLSLAEFGQEVGQKWGVGHKGSDNGVVVLIKPKTGDDAMGKGRAFISTGYGAEGPLPDLLCSKIVDNEMIPHFKDNDYAGGVWAALDILKPALQGDFNTEEYVGDDAADAVLSIIVLIMIVCFVFVVMKSNNNGGNGNNTRTYTGGPVIFPGSFGSGRSTSSWGGGGFGGGGGWGGFGGGSFGGGGGGGSW